MQRRILTIIGLVAGMLFVGCGKTTLGDPPTASPKESSAKPAGFEKEQKKNSELPAIEKMITLRDYLEKRHYKWPDEKESDFPLIIKMEVEPAPDEIKGPFPEDADWRIKEKTPKKKSGSSFWPWS